jgi:hypothetical protein
MSINCIISAYEPNGIICIPLYNFIKINPEKINPITMKKYFRLCGGAEFTIGLVVGNNGKMAIPNPLNKNKIEFTSNEKSV